MYRRLLFFSIGVLTAMAPVAWAQDPPAVSVQEFLIAENMPEATISGEPGVP